MKEEESSSLPERGGDRDNDSDNDRNNVKPYLAASLEQEEKPRGKDRPSIVPAYVQLFAAEHGGETEEHDGES